MTVTLLSVPEFAVYLGKSPQRVYQLVHEGLLEDIGVAVYKTKRGRLWLRTMATSADVSPFARAS